MHAKGRPVRGPGDFRAQLAHTDRLSRAAGVGQGNGGEVPDILRSDSSHNPPLRLLAMDTIKVDTPAEDTTEDTVVKREDVRSEDVKAEDVKTEDVRTENVELDDVELDDEFEEEFEDDEPASADTSPSPTKAMLTGATAVVAAGLGLASLTGTWIGTVMSDREQLIGQIASQSGTPAKQIAAVYGTPWHTVALSNGLFAVVAVIIAAVALLLRPCAPWAKAVAWGGLVLGVIGLLIAGAMWFDVFTSLPVVPTTAAPAAPAG